jgi:hypothetical protein
MMAVRRQHVARIVFRRSRLEDQSATIGQAASPWSDAIAACGASSVAVTLAAVCRAKREGEAGWRPINAVSHILWGPDAAAQRGFTMRYTAAGLVLNVIACGFWALVYRHRRKEKRSSFFRSAIRAFGISAIAYLTDYYVVPRRLTPGFELCLSRRSFPWLYSALAVGLMLPEALTFVTGNASRRSEPL